MTGSQENRLLELYLSNVDIICEGLPDSINARRREYIENFNLVGLPSRKSENYRHSPVSELFERDWEHYFTPMSTTPPMSGEEFEGYNIQLCNGFASTESVWHELECGAFVGSLKTASGKVLDVVEQNLNTLARNDSEALTAINSAFMQDGAFVYIPQGVTVELPIIVSFDYHSEQENLNCFARILVVAEKDSKTHIVVRHRTLSDDGFFMNHVRETIIAEGAEVSFTEISEINSSSAMVSNCYTSQSKQSKSTSVNIWLGGELTRSNNVATLDGEYCENKLYGLYAITNAERCDVNTLVSHQSENCHSFQQIKGIASGNAVGAFTGRVYVAPGAQKTDAVQQSRNLLLSSTARIYTEPQLEIYADDVKCSHGATVGQLDDDSVYYMRQRGISESDARKLQMQGFINEVIMRCEVESVADYIRATSSNILEEF